MSAPTYRFPAPVSPSAEPAVVVRARRARTTSRPTRATYLRRRLAVVLAVLAASVGLVLFGDAMTAEAGGGAAVTGGHAVVQPGQTLWEVAQANRPAGTDVRDYLRRMQELNGIEGGQVGAWSVVLLPRA